jgi:hypothetical protein
VCAFEVRYDLPVVFVPTARAPVEAAPKN